MKNKRPVLLICLAAGLLSIGCAKAEETRVDKEPDVFDKSDIAMGTVVTERIYTRGKIPPIRSWNSYPRRNTSISLGVMRTLISGR